MFKKIVKFFSDLTKSVVFSTIGGIITAGVLLGFYEKMKTFLGTHMDFFLWILIISISVTVFFILEALLKTGNPPYRPKKFAYSLPWRKSPEGKFTPLCKFCGDFSPPRHFYLDGCACFYCQKCDKKHYAFNDLGQTLKTESVFEVMNQK